jgi:hypothetical protein
MTEKPGHREAMRMLFAGALARFKNPELSRILIGNSVMRLSRCYNLCSLGGCDK